MPLKKNLFVHKNTDREYLPVEKLINENLNIILTSDTLAFKY